MRAELQKFSYILHGEACVTLISNVLKEYDIHVSLEKLHNDLKGKENYTGPRENFWVAVSENIVIGMIAIREKRDVADRKAGVTAELKRFYVQKDWRGTGVGKLLFSTAEQYCINEGYTHMWLDSSRKFTKAKQFYIRNNFVFLRHIDNEWEDDVWEKTLQ